IPQPRGVRTEYLQCVASRPDGIVEASKTEIDRRQQFPTAPVLGIALEKSLDLGNGILDPARKRLLPVGCGVHRNRNEIRRSQRKIGNPGSEWKQNDGGGERCPAVQTGWTRCGRGGCGFRGLGGGDQAARYFDPCRLSLYPANQACSLIAADLFQLVAINRDIASGAGRLLTPCERPPNGGDRCKRHQCENQPENHLVTLPGAASAALFEPTCRSDSKWPEAGFDLYQMLAKRRAE